MEKQQWKPWDDHHGYPRVSLYRHHQQYHFLVSRLVAQTFIPNPLGKPEINHKNGNKWDNYMSNLEWVTPEENWLHAKYFLRVTSGDHAARGEKASCVKLTEVQVRDIINRLQNGESERAIALYYKVTSANIHAINIKKIWKVVRQKIAREQNMEMLQVGGMILNV